MKLKVWILVIAVIVAVIIASVIFLPSYIKTKACERAQSRVESMFNFEEDHLTYLAEKQISVLKNDEWINGTVELNAGDFLRFPSGLEAGDLITVKEITEKYALIEFHHYALPPACETVEGCSYICEFKVSRG